MFHIHNYLFYMIYNHSMLLTHMNFLMYILFDIAIYYKNIEHINCLLRKLQFLCTDILVV